ncbi:MmcQ/YjbR family DNA-binding protein [Thalassovita sp.]|uniref:MmcQ/YjbR family DNA-binding protein n=1 Tax=Thalassovita sp. TaxID=1979401 RepID=UPI002B267188|nr:MmcQ/YjbR family DNA-binding protein [Thalassovita sp.]
MTRDGFNRFCTGFPATSHVVQWGNADVWKVADKVLAICGWADGRDAFTFKVSKLAFEVLSDQPGLRPAPYLASRGMSWIQHYDAPGLSDPELRQHIEASYGLVAAGLSQKKRRELGIPIPDHI